jgi:hypothetical protein
MIGSVHLGYHYAVDGYVSVAVTSFVWISAGALARRMHSGREGEPVTSLMSAR